MQSIDDLYTVLLLGNGGREHAWALSLKESGVALIHWAPIVNPGIAQVAIAVITHPYQFNESLLADHSIDLAIIGPEQPLVIGMADWLESLGITVFSPSKKNALLEGSKIYMRELLTRHNITANINYHTCSSLDEAENYLDDNIQVAIKPDGLTGGKGVRVFGDHFKNKTEALLYIHELLKVSSHVLLEEKLQGTEFSLQGLAYGENIVFLPLVKDYKRAFNDDKGPNTGSMGSCSFPDHMLPYISADVLAKAKNITLQVLRALKQENGAYKGAIYAQFMINDGEPKIIEFNARLGDPEAINAFAVLETPLIHIITQLMQGNVPTVRFQPLATTVVYLVPEGYPSNPKAGVTIQLPDATNARFASVSQVDGGYKTTRSRSMAIVGTGATITEARDHAYAQIPTLNGVHYRTDIGAEFTSE